MVLGPKHKCLERLGQLKPEVKGLLATQIPTILQVTCPVRELLSGETGRFRHGTQLEGSREGRPGPW